jgi:hypothetical protein
MDFYDLILYTVILTLHSVVILEYNCRKRHHGPNNARPVKNATKTRKKLCEKNPRKDSGVDMDDSEDLQNLNIQEIRTTTPKVQVIGTDTHKDLPASKGESKYQSRLMISSRKESS